MSHQVQRIASTKLEVYTQRIKYEECSTQGYGQQVAQNGELQTRLIKEHKEEVEKLQALSENQEVEYKRLKDENQTLRTLNNGLVFENKRLQDMSSKTKATDTAQSLVVAAWKDNVWKSAIVDLRASNKSLERSNKALRVTYDSLEKESDTLRN